MKRIMVFTSILMFFMGVIFASESVVDSEIKRVIVYKDRALVSREVSIALEKGESRLMFDFLPENIEPGSLQVKASRAVILQDIEFSTVYYDSYPDEKINTLDNKLRDIQDSIEDRRDAIEQANDEKRFLEKISTNVTTKTEGDKTELDPEKWLKIIEFYSSKREALDETARNLTRQIRNLENEKNKITLELNTLKQGRGKSKNQAVVILQAEKPAEVTIGLSYIVYGPSWVPDYDIRVDSGKKLVDFSYNGMVRQNTGEDWLNVDLVLSTAVPHISGQQPDLIPWYLTLYDPEEYGYRGATGEMNQMYNMMETEDAGYMEKRESTSDSIVIQDATVESGATAVQFDIAGSHTINSDNNSHKVSVFKESFPASFRYSAVPKLSSFAYLKTKIKNDTSFPILKGTAKIFLDGAFVANSSINNVSPGEEFWTFLGIDESISVTYQFVRKEIKEAGIFQSHNKITYHFETTIQNKKDIPIEIVVWDQLPMSQDKDLKITLLEPDYRKDTDSLKKNDNDFYEWLKTINPGEETCIVFKYRVEYPKNKYISGL
ncbi:MAG: mucoidy inhibitor MuiA family protein [Spirochaetales bacterium]|nr:mucoidy inhibitor MuiA family protein [Spirochaetales bacterium]